MLAEILSASPPELSWLGVVALVIGGGGAVKLVQIWDDRRKTSAEADLTDAEADGLRLTQSLGIYRFLEEEVARRVQPLEDRVAELEAAATADREERHKLKTAVIYVVGVARQAIAALRSSWTDDDMRGLPAPLRGHVFESEPLADKLDLTRPRRR